MLKIDFVICWVDGNDPDWQKEYCKYRGIEYGPEAVRFRDWGILKYWFRAVEKYAPWVNNIYFVTNGQCPDWLNIENPKLKFVTHKEYIPNQYLPTFNTNTIELNYHNIKGLSEYFVTFNDDMYINAPILPEYYFKSGLPCDATLENVFGGKGYNPVDKWGISIIDYCNTQALNFHFNRRKVTQGNLKRWYGSYLGLKYQIQAGLIGIFRRENFCNFWTPHNEKPMLKSTYQEAWNKEPELLSASCTTFREHTNLSNYFLRYWQLASNKFYPTKPKGKLVLPITEHNLQQIELALNNSKIKSLCLNDTSACTDNFYHIAMQEIQKMFNNKFPEKSSFEK